MKGFLYSRDGSHAFPLGPKVTTVGRENCDIVINVKTSSRFVLRLFFFQWKCFQNPHVDAQHALFEFVDEHRCFFLKDLNSSSGSFVGDRRIRNGVCRLNSGDFIKFGENGSLFEIRFDSNERETTSMPIIAAKPNNSIGLQIISETIPARTNLNENEIFTQRNRPISAPIKKIRFPFATNIRPNNDRSEQNEKQDKINDEIRIRDEEIQRLRNRVRIELFSFFTRPRTFRFHCRSVVKGWHGHISINNCNFPGLRVIFLVSIVHNNLQ